MRGSLCRLPQLLLTQGTHAPPVTQDAVRRGVARSHALRAHAQWLGPSHLSVTLWWPCSTGSEVATGEGVGTGVRAAVVRTQRGFCSSPLSAPRGLELLALLWGPCRLRASKRRQLITIITHKQMVAETCPEIQLESPQMSLIQDELPTEDAAPGSQDALVSA